MTTRRGEAPPPARLDAPRSVEVRRGVRTRAWVAPLAQRFGTTLYMYFLGDPRLCRAGPGTTHLQGFWGAAEPHRGT